MEALVREAVLALSSQSDRLCRDRIEADTEAGNLAEQRALEKSGFTREGVIRGAGWRDGAWRDGVAFSVLRTDPVP